MTTVVGRVLRAAGPLNPESDCWRLGVHAQSRHHAPRREAGEHHGDRCSRSARREVDRFATSTYCAFARRLHAPLHLFSCLLSFRLWIRQTHVFQRHVHPLWHEGALTLCLVSSLCTLKVPLVASMHAPGLLRARAGESGPVWRRSGRMEPRCGVVHTAQQDVSVCAPHGSTPN